MKGLVVFHDGNRVFPLLEGKTKEYLWNRLAAILLKTKQSVLRGMRE